MSWYQNLKNKCKTKKPEPQNLTDVVRGIQWAVNSANHATENQYIDTIQRFFDIQEDGTYKAVEVDIAIDDRHHTKIPLLALVNPNGLFLKKMKVDMSVCIDKTGLKNFIKDKGLSDVTRSSFNVSFTNKGKNDVQLSMEFESCPLPEGVSRVIENLTNNIQPHKPEPVVKEETRTPVEPEPSEKELDIETSAPV